MENKIYTNEGQLSVATPEIRGIADGIDGEGLDLLLSIYDVVYQLIQSKKTYSEAGVGELLETEHMQRTAAQILESEYSYGCDENGILIATIARYRGIPTKFIQCSDVIPYLTSKGTRGHVYLQSYIGGCSYLLDSTKGLLVRINTEQDKQKLYLVQSRNGLVNRMIEIASGLDPKDAGIFSHRDLIDKFRSANEEYIKQSGIILVEEGTTVKTE